MLSDEDWPYGKADYERPFSQAKMKAAQLLRLSVLADGLLRYSKGYQLIGCHIRV